MKSTKKIVSLLLVLSLTAALLAGCAGGEKAQTSETPAPASAGETTAPAESGVEEKQAPPAEEPAVNHVRDVTGREVDVPANASHVVVLPGPALEKTLLLGVADRVGGMLKSCKTPWAEVVYPAAADKVIFNSSKEPGMEEIMNLGAEFVVCHDYADLNEQLDKLGIPYVITQCSGELPYHDLEGFLQFQKDEVNTFAQAFGGAATANAEKWIRYFEEKVNYVRSRTDSIAEADRPRVYYARSDEGLVTFSKNSYPHYLVELAGGYYVSKDTPEEMNSTLTLEQIMEWDPDIIFMGRMDNTGIILDNPAWSGIQAVKDGKVYLCPSGVFNWDYSGESVLLMLYLAKYIQPELFADLDIEAEIRYYYSTFYGYELSDQQLERILSHMAPA